MNKESNLSWFCVTRDNDMKTSSKSSPLAQAAKAKSERLVPTKRSTCLYVGCNQNITVLIYAQQASAKSGAA